MNKSCAVFCGGDPVSRACVESTMTAGAYIICADKGLRLAEGLGLTPDLIIGDFDSIDQRPVGDNVLTYPVEKDDTDLMLAIKTALEMGYDRFQIYGALGGRLDHTLGNIQSLMYLLTRGAWGEIIADDQHIAMYTKGEYRFLRREGWSLSFFAYSGEVSAFSVHGTKYEADNCLLKNDFPLGISNKVTAGEAVMSFGSGTVLAVQSRL